MAILRYLITILTAWLLTGCYEDFNPDIDTRPVLCLNSMIVAGQPINVEVTHTWMFNDVNGENNHTVTDAEVTVIVNETIVGPDYLPQEGDKIRIEAESATYGNATAEVEVPCAATLTNVKVTPTVKSVWRFNDDYGIGISFNLNIEADVEDRNLSDDYYHFGYSDFSIYTGEPANDIYSSPFAPMISLGAFEYNAEPIFREHIGTFETIMGNDTDTEFFFFSDRQFSGNKYTLHLNFTDNVYRFYSNFDMSQFENGVSLKLTAVSQSYYNWVVYRWNVDEGILGELSDIGLAESRWGYSNVSTGAGVVAALTLNGMRISLDEFFQSIINSN